MAPLATAFVLVLPNMAAFPAAAAAGIRSSNLAAAGAAQGAAFGTSFARSASKLMAAGVVVGLGVLLKESVQAAGDFEAQMVRLVTSAGETGNLVSGNLKIVADGIKAMAGPVGTTVEALGKAMYTVESGSFHGADALKVLQAAAEGAKAENADLTKVTNATTTALVDYHLSANHSAEVVTKLVAATAAGKTTFEQLTGALHSVLPVASAAGVSLDDILGSLASMTLHGISAEQATQNLADAIRHMQNPTAVQAKELALLGLTTNQLADDLRTKGLSGTLQMISDRIRNLMPPGSQQVILQLQTALGTLSPEVRKLGMQLIQGSISYIEYRKAARDLTPIQAAQAMSFAALAGATHRIGDEQLTGAQTMQSYSAALAKATGDATGMNVALMLTGENAGTTATAIGMVAAATVEAGGHVKGWAEIQETFNFKMAAMKASLGVAAVAIGESLLPALGHLFEGITAILGPMAEWITDHQTLTTIIAGSLASFLALGTAVIIIAKVAGALKLLAAALRLAAIAQFLFLSPWGLIILGITAVVAALVYAYFHFDVFRRFVDKLWQSLQVAARDVWAALVVAFHAIGDAAIWLWQHALGPAFRFMVAAIKAWWEYAQFVFNLLGYVIMNAVVPYVTWMWQHVWGPAFKGMTIALKAWWEYAQFVFGLVKDIIMNGVVPYVTWMWQHVWEPAFSAMGVVIRVWWEYAKFVFDLLKAIIMDLVVPAVLWMWHGAFEPAFSAIGFLIKAWWVIIQVVFAAVKLAVETLIINPIIAMWHLMEFIWPYVSGLVSVWWSAVKVVFLLFMAAIDFLLIEPIKRFVAITRPLWQAIGDFIGFIWEHGMKPTFQNMANFITLVIPDAFRKGAGFIKAAWELIYNYGKDNVNFVIRYVINDGIIKAWNTVAKWLGVKDQIGTVPLIGATTGGGGGGGAVPRFMAGGGLLSGPGGPTDDRIPIMASAGEYVIPARVVGDIGVPFFDALIGRRKPMRPGDGSQGIAIGRYAEGGLVGGLMGLITDPAAWVGDQVNGLIDKIPGAGIIRDIGVAASRKLVTALINWVKAKIGFGGGDVGATQSWLRSQDGKPYIWASAGPAGYDCSGIVSAVWNMLHGRSPYSHTFSTMNEAPYFPNPGMGVFTAGWANAGEKGGGSVGHTAGWLAGLPFESTGSRGVHIGTGVTPVDSFAHMGHMAGGGLVRSFDRGGSWPSGTLGYNGSGRTEHVSTGTSMDKVIAELQALRRDVQAIAPGVGAELTGAASSTRQMARTR